ncbi:MAG: glycosyltransferase family 39 protein [Nitrospinota bacterium]
MEKKNSIQNRLPFFIFAASLIVRAIYLWQQQTNPLNAYPLGDSVTYMREAERILSGDWAGSRVFTFGGAAFYPYFLALIFSVAGKSVLTVQIIQFFMGALTCTLIYLIGEKLYGKRVAVLLGVTSALFPPFLFHEGLLLTGSPGLLFLISGLYLLVCREKMPHLFFAGLALGLSVLCRPNTLLLAPLFFGWILTGKSLKRVKAALLFFVGVSVVIFPVTLRNYLVGKDLVLISSSGGLNFFIGNNPLSKGIFSIPPNLEISNDSRMYITSESYARKETGRELKPSEVSTFWFKKGTDFIFSDPGKAFVLLLKKISLFFNAREITNLYKFNFFSEHSSLLPLSVPPER